MWIMDDDIDFSKDPAQEEATAVAAPVSCWHVNKTGFPIGRDTWEQMWQHVVRVHPQGASVVAAIRNKPGKKEPLQAVPNVSMSQPVEEGLLAVQSYIQHLQYNHTGTQFFEIRKKRSLSRLMETAKEMVHEALPIKCLEAVIVVLYLTAPLLNVARFTISFKSKFRGTNHRHIVLAVTHGGRYGALGLSRRHDLMYKPLEYKTLTDLVMDYLNCYKQYNHTVVKLKLSSPIAHDVHSCEQIHWKFLMLDGVDCLHKDELKRALDRHARIIKTHHSGTSL